MRSSGDAQNVLRQPRSQVLAGVEAQAALQFGQSLGGQGKADGEGVAAEAGEEIGAALDGVEQMEAIDGAAGAVGDTVFYADHDGRLGGALDDAGGENADDAAVPAVAVNEQQPVDSQLVVRSEADFNGGECGGLGLAALVVEPLELGGQLGGAGRIAGGE
jgi:hypothetical protein